MKASKAIQNFIKKEGNEGYRKFQYSCSNGYPTIGYGHKLKKGEIYSSGVDLQQAESLFQKDLYIAELQIQKALQPVLGTLTQGMYDAIVSLVFNIGIGQLTVADRVTGRSTKCYASLLRGDFKDAAFHMFDKDVGFTKVRAGGKLTISSGLAKRRAGERVFFGY